MDHTFTAWDASQLPLSWYREHSQGLSEPELHRVRTTALATFAEYRDRFKTWPEWLALMTTLTEPDRPGCD